jgi:hypothetical protein
LACLAHTAASANLSSENNESAAEQDVNMATASTPSDSVVGEWTDINKCMTPLHLAALNGHLDMVEALLRLNKGDPFLSSYGSGATPLYQAYNDHLLPMFDLLSQDTNNDVSDTPKPLTNGAETSETTPSQPDNDTHSDYDEELLYA